MLALAITIDKSQGQTFIVYGLYLPRPVFSHGQLYVALSRISNPKNIKVFIDAVPGLQTLRHTRNIVFKEILLLSNDQIAEAESYTCIIPTGPPIENIKDQLECFFCCQPILTSMHIARWNGACECYTKKGMHRECIATWLKCPSCRAKIVAIETLRTEHRTFKVNPIIQQLYRFPQRFSDSPSWLYIPIIQAAFKFKVNHNTAIIIDTFIPPNVWNHIVHAYQQDFTSRDLCTSDYLSSVSLTHVDQCALLHSNQIDGFANMSRENIVQ